MTQRTDTYDLKPCPFCGEQPELGHGFGTQYNIECECGMANSSVQISDLMTLDERNGGWDPDEMRFQEQFVKRAEAEAIEMWNRRTPPVIAPPTAVPVDGDAMREKAILQLGRICMMLPVSEAEKCAEIRTALPAQSKATAPAVAAPAADAGQSLHSGNIA